MEGRGYHSVINPEISSQPVNIEENFFSDEVHLQAVKVIVALYLLVTLTQADLLENLHLVKMGQLIKINKGKDYTNITQALQSYYKKYIAISVSQEKLKGYGSLFTRLKYSVRFQDLFNEQDLITDTESFTAINASLSAIFSILEKVFSEEKVEDTLAKSPKLGSDEDKFVSDFKSGTKEEEDNLIRLYHYPQILSNQNKLKVLSYQNLEQMFENLDRGIFKMMKQGQDDLASHLLKHRMLLVTFLLNNKNSSEKIELVETLSQATADVIDIFASNLPDAKEINKAVNVYYATCVASNAALSADSTGKRIIKSAAAIAGGLLFCALVLSMAWLISYFWLGIVLADVSWKIQTGIVITTGCLLAISGFFSHGWLRGKGCLDSEINQSTKTITEHIRQTSNSP